MINFPLWCVRLGHYDDGAENLWATVIIKEMTCHRKGRKSSHVIKMFGYKESDYIVRKGDNLRFLGCVRRWERLVIVRTANDLGYDRHWAEHW